MAVWQHEKQEPHRRKLDPGAPGSSLAPVYAVPEECRRAGRERVSTGTTAPGIKGIGVTKIKSLRPLLLRHFMLIGTALFAPGTRPSFAA